MTPAMIEAIRAHVAEPLPIAFQWVPSRRDVGEDMQTNEQRQPRRDEDGLCAGREPAEKSPTGHLGTCGECAQAGLRIDPDGNVWAHLPRSVAPSA